MCEKYIELGDIMEINYTKQALQEMENTVSSFYDKTI